MNLNQSVGNLSVLISPSLTREVYLELVVEGSQLRITQSTKARCRMNQLFLPFALPEMEARLLRQARIVQMTKHQSKRFHHSEVKSPVQCNELFCTILFDRFR